tara:strand:+ start:300 stop:488 length:189 start_codon:yes stop_codon:yes gene_type:complete
MVNYDDLDFLDDNTKQAIRSYQREMRDLDFFTKRGAPKTLRGRKSLFKRILDSVTRGERKYI